MKIVLLANGPIRDYNAAQKAMDGFSYVIACDGGLRHAQALKVTPDCVIGDMDSAPVDIVAEFVERGLPLLLYPPDKDETDLTLCMARALAQNASSVVVLGALGGRFDHTLANIHVLVMAQEKGVPAELWDENTCIRVIGQESVIAKGDYDTVSLIPLTSEVKGIVTQGLQYPLNGETLRVGTTRGVSNRFIAKEASVTVTDGLLLVVCVKLNKQ